MAEIERVVLPATVASTDEELEYTSRVRRAVIDKILEDVDNLTDIKVASLLSVYLDSVDRQALGKKRAETAAAAAKGIGSLAGALDAIVVNAGIKFHRPPEEDDCIEGESYTPHIPDLPNVAISEGTLDPVGTNVDVIKLMDEDIKRRRAEQE